MEFDTLDSRPGLAVFDSIENVRFELYTSTAIVPERVATDDFHFPVDTAVGFESPSLEIPNRLSAVIRTQDGAIAADGTAFEDLSLPDGDYLVELQSTPMKLYVAVTSALELVHDEESVTIRFDGRRRLRVGARSFHDSPAGTITVPGDVESEMAALSLLGSALKTTSCERSFPTLRGHPPLVEHGDEFSTPDGIEAPDTGVELVLPPERGYVYPAASLAYYLGAEVVAGSDPQLVAGEFGHSLDGPDGYETTVNRTLKQVFFFDCLTRTEGYYPVELHERQQVEPLVNLDFADLYDRSLTEQVAAYLSVPFETLEPHVLDWHLTTDVVPVADNLPALPYFADELSLLRTPQNPETRTIKPKPEILDEFTRSAVAADDFTRSASEASAVSEVGDASEASSVGLDPSDLSRGPDDLSRGENNPWDWDDDEMFQIPEAETVEHAWVGNGYPIGANKVTLESLRRQVGRTPPDDSALTVHVVCNDPRMAGENVVSEFYGLRDLVTYDVTIHEELTADELAALFESSADFLHYIGHVDDAGFRCADGYLDAASLGDVGVEAFLLNACQSYRQGRTLVEKGSRGGVVTLSEVVNSAATRIGRTLARLLNCGFTLRSALSVAKDESVVAIEYITIGNGGLTLCQSASGVPVMYQLHRDGEEFLLEHHTFPSPAHGLGSFSASAIENSPVYYLVSGPMAEFRLSKEELDDVLELELTPIKINGHLYWSDELSVTDL